MNIARSVGCMVAVSLAVCAASVADAAAPKRLEREEVVALFARLSAAAGTAKTFQATMRRSDKSTFVLDDAPIVSEGKVWIERPSRFRQEIVKPRASATIVSEHDLWVYFPAAAEAQHVDLRKGLKGRSDTTSESIMPWLTFDLTGLERTYKVTAKRAPTPANASVKKCPPPADGPVDVAAVPATKPEECFMITFVPTDAKSAPGMASLSIVVDGVNPWPLTVSRESVDGDLQTTEFGDIVLDAPLNRKLFEFRPPRGAKVVELSGQ